ncbi:hypothetical protein ACFWDI_06340 [Streptomyces sp. NPDC060064]|uniref:hypothetical protein n=1 Tax=Streptomyces sp. NPDC060064 TaxID=3347049 RepID=UPI0036BF9803
MKKILCGFVAAAAAAGNIITATSAHASDLTVMNLTNHTSCDLSFQKMEGNFDSGRQPDMKIGVDETSRIQLSFGGFLPKFESISYEAVSCKSAALNGRILRLFISASERGYSYNFNDSSPRFGLSCPRGASCRSLATIPAEVWEAAP